MKKGIEAYGLVVILVIALCPLLLYFFSQAGFQGQLQKSRPKTDLASSDQSGLIHGVTSRGKPTLTAKTQKLKRGETYDLLAVFKMKSENADGEPLPVKIDEVKYQDGTKCAISGTQFTPQKAGTYTVHASAEEVYQTFTLKTEQQYRFASD